ncbi:MAG: DUF2029 domain-containing protein [Planctomycetia bacterium]|nr:DUF2029 domain-containing protein [Planctomycetia bacterium]
MPPTLSAQPSAFRRLLLVAGAVVVVIAGASQLDRLFSGGLNAPLDFAAFWAAGHLTVHGENPYHGDRLQEAQTAVGLTDLAVIAWNPPWTLALLMPFGALPFRAAHGVWVVLHLGLMATSAVLLWRAFDGVKCRSWVALAITLTFVPTAFLIGNGQLTAFVLFGLAGFALACRAERPFLAGAALALCATKPHLFVPLGAWILIAGCRSGFGCRVLLGAITVGLLLCVPPTLAVPHVWSDYITAVTGPADPRLRPLSEWKPPLVGWWLRQAVPGTPFWVQWIPMVFAAVAVAGWCLKNRTRLTPSELLTHLPWLVGLSLLVAPYGAWQHDLVLLLVPILAVAARMANPPDRRSVAIGIAWLASVNAVSLVMMVNSSSSEWYVWFAPCVLLGTAVLGRPTSPSSFPSRREGEKHTADCVLPSASKSASYSPLPAGRGVGVGPTQ